MDVYEQAFRLLPDTVIITDVYWYILDFNHTNPFNCIKKGWSLTRVMPDCRALPSDRLRRGGRVYQRGVTPVYAQSLHVGGADLAAPADCVNQFVQFLRQPCQVDAGAFGHLIDSGLADLLPARLHVFFRPVIEGRA